MMMGVVKYRTVIKKDVAIIMVMYPHLHDTISHF